MTFYNEFDRHKAAWLRELANSGEITNGDVDERSIKDLRADDVAGYNRAHFFAGIGVWDYAMRLAGWPVAWPVWSASCPCQPFSSAGRRKGTEDERHLWPWLMGLIAERHPPVIFGEQVASPDGLKWFDGSQEGLCELRDRQAVLRVLRKLERETEEDLRRMHEGEIQETQAGQPRAHQGNVLRLEKEEARVCTSCGRQIQGEDQKSSVQFRLGRHTGTSGSWGVRINWDSLFTERAESVECPLFGQGDSISGLRDRQRQGGDLCPECDGKYMGTAEDCRDCVGDFEGAPSRESAVDLISWGKDEEVDAKYSFGTVRGDLESAGYAVGILDTCAAGVGAPHARQRLYWCALRLDGLADKYGAGLEERERQRGDVGPQRTAAERGGGAGRLEHAAGNGREQWWAESGGRGLERGRSADGVGDSDSHRCDRKPIPEFARREGAEDARSGFTRGHWAGADWVLTRPQRVGDHPGLRPVEPGTFPLADGAPERVGRLRGYGDAIVATQAAAFIRCVMEEITERAR